MNTTLWKNILDFDLDQPVSEYGFSTRLENENYWTTNFAQIAVIEYKKFMFLAAVSESMVSPSEIIDTVWHQHLIFTESYDNFCSVLGKKIIHIPSTHQKNDLDKFKLAKEETNRLYKDFFGEQPSEFWEYPNMLVPLKMQRSSISESKVFWIGILLLIPLIYIAYFILKPLYIQMETPYFFIFYALTTIISVVSLELYNRKRLNEIIKRWDNRSFIFNLSAFELVYLKQNKIENVIHGVVNHLILDKKISVLPNKMLAAKHIAEIQNPVDLTVLQTIRSHDKISYPDLLIELKRKPVFNKTVRAIEGFKKYFNLSKNFIQLFIINFIVLSVLLLLGIVRIATGFFRDKPIITIGIIVIVLVIFVVQYLCRLKSLVSSVIIPKFYNEGMVSLKPSSDDWEWSYFLLGSAIFATSFKLLVSEVDRDRSSFGDSGGDSSSSCSSDGDSGCGGCGGSD